MTSWGGCRAITCGVLAAALMVCLPFLRDAQIGRPTKLSSPAASSLRLGELSMQTSTEVPATNVTELACGHLPIDDWNTSKPFLPLLFDGDANHQGAQFGNQLFSGAYSIMKAISQSRPLLVVPHQHPHTKMKQIYQLPCIRSSRNVQPEIDKLCSGCLNENWDIWQDRSASCGKKAGCLSSLMARHLVVKLGAYAIFDLTHWKLLWRRPFAELLPIFRTMFYTPLPEQDPEHPTPLPADVDLVIHFRSYYEDLFFDLLGGVPRMASMPFVFFRWAVEHHRKKVKKAFKIWVVTAPEYRAHPTVKRLLTELKADLFTGWDNAAHPWMADFAWIQEASQVVLSMSTFSWWAGFLSHRAETIYTMIPPVPAMLPWCDLMPDDPRYIFYDFFNDEVFDTLAPARERCVKAVNCKKPGQLSTCLPIQQWAPFFPELLAILPETVREMAYLRAHNVSSKR